MTEECQANECPTLHRKPQSRLGKIKSALGWNDWGTRFWILTCVSFFVFVFAVVGSLVYMLVIDDNPPITWNHLDWVATEVIINSDPRVPTTATLENGFCKHTDAIPEIRGAWINGLKKDVMMAQPRAAEMGCHEGLKIVNVPHDLPDGEYYLEMQAIYQVNPLKVRSVTKRTETTILVINPYD